MPSEKPVKPETNKGSINPLTYAEKQAQKIKEAGKKMHKEGYFPKMPPLHIGVAVFASGSGSNAEAVVKKFRRNPLIRASLLVTNKSKAPVIKRLEKYNIGWTSIDGQDEGSWEDLSISLYDHRISYIVLAGFLWKLPAKFVEEWEGRIINIHPSLLPKFGGKGMHGLNIHKAVLAAGETETGITIHLVNQQYDEGQILFQKKINIMPGENAEALQTRVLELEHKHYPEIIKQYILDQPDPRF